MKSNAFLALRLSMKFLRVYSQMAGYTAGFGYGTSLFHPQLAKLN
jgi:hypothetical protein